MNPFSPEKVLYNMHYWEVMERMEIPPPLCVQLSPTNLCNLDCVWCMAEKQRTDPETATARFPEWAVDELPGFLSDWGVGAVYITGGGEPLMWRPVDDLIRNLRKADIQIGLYTNGVLLNHHKHILPSLDWLGVSVDAGNAEDYDALKGGGHDFERVVENIRMACLDEGLEVTWKFVMYPGNLKGMFRAAELAEAIGCKYIHFRPAAPRWWDNKKTQFTKAAVRMAMENLAKAHKLLDGIKVIGGTGKYNQHFEVEHPFKTCHAVGMWATFEADGTLQLCCDHKNNPALTLCRWDDLSEVAALWGGLKHQEIMASIDVSKCPKCTQSKANELYEQFCMRDDTWKFFI